MLNISTVTLEVDSQPVILKDIVHYYYNGDKIVFIDFDEKETSYLALSVEVVNVETKTLTNKDFTLDNFENFSFI